MASLFLIAALAATVPAPLEPSGSWVVDFGENQCAASRSYGGASNTLILALRQSPFDDVTHLLVVRSGKFGQWAEQETAELTLGSAPPVKTFMIRFRGAKSVGERVLHQLSLSPDQVQQLVAAPSVGVKSGSILNASFSLKQMASVAKLLNDCTHDLRRYWNMGEWGSAVAIQPEPVKDVRTLFSPADYPQDAQRADLEGKAQVMLLIDEKGATKSCHVIHREGSPVFEAMSCQVLLKRASFRPAKDLRGRPIRSSYMSPFIVFRFRQ